MLDLTSIGGWDTCWNERLSKLGEYQSATPVIISASLEIKTIITFGLCILSVPSLTMHHGLRTPREEIAFTARPKIQLQSQIFRYGQSIFCLPHQPNFSDIFDLYLHWVSVVRGLDDYPSHMIGSQLFYSPMFEKKADQTYKNLF